MKQRDRQKKFGFITGLFGFDCETTVWFWPPLTLDIEIAKIVVLSSLLANSPYCLLFECFSKGFMRV